MEFKWDIQAEIERYSALWQSKPPSGIKHSPTIWDERAQEWESGLRSNDARYARSERRINSIAAFLRSRGLLNSKEKIIDIGCGPGRFVATFAKTAEHVIGFDLSPRMAEFGARYASEMGLKNVSFESGDFKSLDIDEKHWRGQFDLVFSSITPAISSLAETEKMIALSRAYCFNCAYVYAFDPIEEELFRDLHQTKPPRRWDGRTFYAMLNLLWLRGYFPEVTYYKEFSEERILPDRSLAVRIAEKRLPDATEADLAKIQQYLAERAGSDGLLLYPTTRWYGLLLWDIRDQSIRNY